MNIVDLSADTRKDYFSCLEDWSPEIADGVCRKECWYDAMKDNGLRVKLAVNDDNVVAGMIQYAPIEHSWVVGENLYFVYCIWVHGHNKGRGDLRKKGIGTALLKAAEEDAKSLQTNGLVTWGLILPFFMRAKWFKKHGYKKVDRKGISVLLWKPFNENATPPHWIKASQKPKPIPGKVLVTALSNGWCTATNGMLERAKKVCAEFGDFVVYQELNTNNRDVVRQWGISDGLFIDKKNIHKGPPLTTEQIRKQIQKKVNKLR